MGCGMVEIVEITIPGDPLRTLNPNNTCRLHWGQIREAKRTWQFAAYAAWCNAGYPVFRVPVVIQFTLCRVRAVDPDNALSGLQSVVNGLKGNLFPDDSPRWVQYAPVEQITGKEWRGREKIVVRVRALG